MSIVKNTSTKDETDNSGTAIISHTVHGYTTELTDAVEKVQSKIVTVNIFSEETNKSLTGVIYASNSNGTYIVTSASLLSEEETITVKFDNNISLKAELIGIDKDTDVAVLFVKPEFDTDAITLGDSDILKTGEYVFALSGRPEETDAGIASFGVISSNIQTVAASNKHINEVLFSDVVETDITDGAPLFNVNGDMIGMLTKEVVVTSYSKYSAAISINELKLVADELISSEVVDRGYLGVIGRNISDIKAYEKGSYGLQLDIADGILVTRVVENSPAMQAGILMNDVVVGINENEVRSLKDLRNFLYNAKPEDSVNITLNRFGNLITVTVVLQ